MIYRFINAFELRLVPKLDELQVGIPLYAE
jgi:hypothetical protein